MENEEKVNMKHTKIKKTHLQEQYNKIMKIKPKKNIESLLNQ